MKLILNDQEKLHIEIAAIQKVVDKRIQLLVEARAEEIEREISTEDTEYTVSELARKFVNTSTRVAAAAGPTILVPQHPKH